MLQEDGASLPTPRKSAETVPSTAESNRNSRRLRAERSKSVTPPHVAVVPDGISPGLPEHPDEVAALMRIPEVWRPSGPVPDVSRSSRGAAAAGTRIFRGDESRRRRGRNADIPRRRVAAPRRGYSAETSRGGAAAGTWIFRGDTSPACQRRKAVFVSPSRDPPPRDSPRPPPRRRRDPPPRDGRVLRRGAAATPAKWPRPPPPRSRGVDRRRDGRERGTPAAAPPPRPRLVRTTPPRDVEEPARVAPQIEHEAAELRL